MQQGGQQSVHSWLACPFLLLPFLLLFFFLFFFLLLRRLETGLSDQKICPVSFGGLANYRWKDLGALERGKARRKTPL